MRGCEQGIAIRTYRIEGDVAEIEQPCRTDDDVQPEGKQRKQDGKIRNAYPGSPNRCQRERQNAQGRDDERKAQPCRDRMRSQLLKTIAGSRHGQARSETRSPNRPDGRNTSTAIRTRKAKTSW